MEWNLSDLKMQITFVEKILKMNKSFYKNVRTKSNQT